MRTMGLTALLVLGLLAGTATAGDVAWLLNRADLVTADLTGEMPADADEWQSDYGGGDASVYGIRRGAAAVPMLMSLLVPGAGEIYLGHKRGYLQVALDAASWYGAVHNDQQGNDMKDEYYLYADAHWFEDKLEAGYDPGWFDQVDRNFDYDPMAGDGLDYFSTTESVLNSYLDLPLWVSLEDDRREYYENLSKWDQFVFGWDDYNDPRNFLDTDSINIRNLQDPRTSEHREEYRRMRRESNDFFGNRDRFLYLSVAFRLFSVLQVAYLEGLLFGDRDAGTPDQLQVGSHEVEFFVKPVGYTRGLVGARVSF